MGEVSSAVRTWMYVGWEFPIQGLIQIMLIVLVSVALGLTVNAFRRTIVDTFHHWTGLSQPCWDEAKLTKHGTVIERYHLYYVFFSNCLFAILFGYITGPLSVATAEALAGTIAFHAIVIIALHVIVIVLICLGASRQALKRYYQQVSLLLDE